MKAKFLSIFLICLFFNTFLIESNFIYFSLTKELYIPGSRFSLINITHNLNDLTPSMYTVDAELVLSQVTQKNQTNSVFDFLYEDLENYSTFINCYDNTVSYLNTLYSQYQPCEEKCSLQSNTKNRLFQLQQPIGNSSSPTESVTFIIDNTFYPCSDGVYQPQLYLFEQINLKIQSNQAYFMVIKISKCFQYRKVCVLLLQILIFLLAFIMIMLAKLHARKSKLLKLKQEYDNKQVLKCFIQSKNKDQ